MEKYILRKAFEDLLPKEILWRQKEQFSDGVGYSWVDDLQVYAEKTISDDEFSKRLELFPHNTPDTKEAFLYRKIYHQFYAQSSCEKLVKKWIPKWQENKDPSGRANQVHLASYTSTTDKEEQPIQELQEGNQTIRL